jgi:hypothetical protein
MSSIDTINYNSYDMENVYQNETEFKNAVDSYFQKEKVTRIQRGEMSKKIKKNGQRIR